MSARDLTALEGRVRNMVKRGVIRKVDDERLEQEVQIDALQDETHDAMERPQPYGFSAHPHDDAEAVMLAAGGLESHGIVLMINDRRYRMKAMRQGEVAMYDDLGNFVQLGRDSIEVNAVADMNVKVAGNCTVLIEGDADIDVQGNVTAHVGGDVTATVDGNADATISGTADLHVEGDLTVEAGANAAVAVAGTLDAQVAGNATIHSDATALVEAATANVKATGAASIEAGGTCLVKGSTVNVDAGSVNLGGTGGARVARIGDSIDTDTKKITGGSNVVRAT